jgi:superfamily II DNA helicase RecQ
LNSSLTAREAGMVIQRAREGHLKILYIAPERIRSNEFDELLSTLTTLKNAATIAVEGLYTHIADAKRPEGI